MKRVLAVSTVLSVLGLLVFAATAGAAAHLDRSFGKRGRAIVRPGLGQGEGWSQVPTFAAREPDGSTVVVGSTYGVGARLVRFERDGSLDRGFGTNGVVHLQSLDGIAPSPPRYGSAPVGFEPVGIAVDGAGRIVLPGRYGGSRQVVVRLLPDGSPDPSFGGTGAVEPDLEFHPDWKLPISGTGARLNGVAVDPSGRIVLAGTSEIPATCVGNGFLVRLLRDGTPDPSFGGGSHQFPDGEPLNALGPVLGPGGSITSWGNSPSCHGPSSTLPQIDRVSEAGQPEAGFGGGGAVFVRETPTALAVDARGRTTFAFREGTIRRLSPSGASEPGFNGGKGVFRFGDGEDVIAGLAVAGDGSILVTGHREAKSKDGAKLLLGSLTANGRPRPGFGKRGTVLLDSSKGVGTIGSQVFPLGTRAALVAGSTGSAARGLPTGIGLFRFRLAGHS